MTMCMIGKNIIIATVLIVSATAHAVVPDWLGAKIDAALQRYQTWKGEDETVVFTMMTDLHDWKRDHVEGDSLKNHKEHIPFAIEVGDRFQADFAADLGDIGSDIVIGTNGMRDATFDEMKRRWQSQYDLYDKTKRPVFHCIGNHDLNYGKDGKATRVEPREFGEYFAPLAHGAEVVWGEGRDYGYWDVPGHNCRIIFLDTMEWGHSYGLKQGQLKFLAKALQVPDGFTVMAMMHAPLQKSFSCWLKKDGTMSYRDAFNGIYAKFGTREALRMFEDFVSHAKGESGGVAWDFTALKNNHLAGLLYGHAHFDNTLVQYDVRHIVRQGHGWINRKTELPKESGARYCEFSRVNDTCIDVVAIKPKTGSIGIFRVGANDENGDVMWK